jgi:hypothetical protein
MQSKSKKGFSTDPNLPGLRNSPGGFSPDERWLNDFLNDIGSGLMDGIQ